MDHDPLRRVEQGLEDMRAGKIVILVDDEDRENEGDLTMASDRVTPEAINFMATYGRGLICLTLTADRVRELGLPMMASNNLSPYHTAFTVSIEAREGVTTGISAADRAQTIKVAIDPSKGPLDLVTPGHIFPLRARDGGVLVRTGQTEGSVDLARLSGLTPSGVICEIMNDDGTMARMPDLERFAATHKLHILSVADIIKWRLRNERLVLRVLDARLPMPEHGEFNCRVYRSVTDGGIHIALWKGQIPATPLVRVQAADPIGDVFRAGSSDAAAQLQTALTRIAEEGGVLLYMNVYGGRSEADLLAMFKSHLLPQQGAEELQPEARAPEASGLREFGSGAQILLDMGIREMRLLTNNPRKIVGLEGFGLRVVERVPIEVQPTDQNRGFLAARAAQLGHLLNLRR
ncbi:MAG: 3,4-dihydroxy-2-butanone-4-phosphate synthase [Deltaproteobacteria bacterium]|nr:3,4-dihydroxy-2-butanone-4-phosphate synthase [Deltaproteobacteria bacterium]MBK9643622.1 3,4-dihydroxy-2-butanone-4-phosphate synthase [Deltaproteobacteria bacterium]